MTTPTDGKLDLPSWYDPNAPTIDIFIPPNKSNTTGGKENTDSTPQGSGLGTGNTQLPDWVGEIALFALGFILFGIALWTAVSNDD